MTTILRILMTCLIGIPILSPAVLFPKTGYHWSTVMMARTVVPVSLGNFYLYACSKYVGLKLDMINTSTDKTESDSETD